MGRFSRAKTVPLYLVDLAHSIRVAIEDESIRSKALGILNATIERQNRVLLGREGKRGPDGHNYGRRVPNPDWPLPIEHGIEDAPGCVLTLCAINDFAESRPDLFYRVGHEFEPFLSEPRNAAQFMFSWGWLNQVDEFKAIHKRRLRTVVDYGIAFLKGKPLNGRAKRGRKLSSNPRADAKLAADWESARANGSYKADFAKSKGYKPDDFQRLLTRVRRRKNSAR